jgi:hypothetical protein
MNIVRLSTNSALPLAGLLFMFLLVRRARANRVFSHRFLKGRIRMNSLKSHLFVIGCILVGLCSPAWAANLGFGQIETGTISSPAQSNSYTFSANANDLIDLAMVPTSGNLSPEIRLYNPAGTLIATAYNGGCPVSPVEMNTALLLTSGTYTVLVSDCSDTNTGNYTLYAQRTNNPSGAVNLPFGQTESGTIGSVALSNTYTFSASANDVVDFTMVPTNGTLSPRMRLYSPAGALIATAYNGGCPVSPVEMNGVTLPVSGTYTMLVGACGDTGTGNYEIYAQRTNHPSGPITLLWGQVQTGSISSAAQNNSYTFSASANDVVNFAMVPTSGSLSPRMRLYNPAGVLIATAYNGGCPVSPVEMNTVTLSASGTYTMLVGDCSDTNTGNYTLYAQRTNSPAGPIALLWGQVQTSSISSVAQSDTYTFSASANDVVNFAMVPTNGSLSPRIRLYNPAGALIATAYNGGCPVSPVEMNTVTLPVGGTYTMLVGACGDTDIGNYVIYSQRTNNPSGPIGLLWGQVQSGKIGSAAQSNTYTFVGSANDSVDFTMVPTNGTLSPRMRLYNPAGALIATAYNGGCPVSPVEMNGVTLPVSGTYTMLVGACGDTDTGNYNLSSECFGTCPPQTTTATLSPKSLSFAKQLVGTTSSAKILKLTNSGTGTLTISDIIATGNFTQTNNCPGTVAAGSSCTVNVTFTPTIVGAVLGAISFYDNASGSPQVAPLSGAGIGAVSVAPASLSFGTVSVGTTTTAKTVTVTNNSAASVSLSFTASSDYAASPGSSNGCGATLAAKAKCTLAVTFSPKQSSAINGSLAVSGSGFATQMVALTGSGSGGPTATLSFSPATASIINQLIGTTSASKVVTITNKGTTAVTISSLTASAEFTAVGSGATPCGGTLAAGAKCTFSVTFTPSVAGSIKGSVTIANNSTVNPMLYPLSGSGVLPVSFSPTSLTFAAQAVGTTSAPKTVTLTNNQTVLLNITSITVSGDYAAAPGGTTPCGATVAAKGKCTFQVTFTPTMSGTIKGAVDIAHDAPGSPQVVGLTGTGQ